MKYKIHLIYILIIFLSSCAEEIKYAQCAKFELDDNLKMQTLQLKGKALTFDIEVNRPVRILSFDSLLILNNMSTELLIDIYNINNNKKICSNISVGSGPNELLMINKIQRTDSSLLLFDQMKGKLFEYSINNFCTDHPKPLSITKLGM